MPLHLVPLSTISWKDAFKKLVEGVALPVSYHEGEFVNTPNQRLPVPSVIIMKDYKSFNKKAKFSKFNVKLRDGFKCQYCGSRRSSKSLTIDHVIAKSHGGRLTWSNSVAACKPCNNKKKNEYKMRPMRDPYVPDYFEFATKMLQYQGIEDTEWEQYTSFLTKKK